MSTDDDVTHHLAGGDAATADAAGDGESLWKMSAGALATLVRRGELSAQEVCERALARIDELDPLYGAFCTVDGEGALAAARRVDASVAAGQDPGPLAGVPVGIKDLICTRGLRTTFSSWHYRDYVPDCDDVAVARLREAGAVVVGKTTSSEFGYSALADNDLFPTPKNPHNPEWTTGGSSAGSGAAVAYGAVPIAIGSDGGGSIRIPAAFCGVVGFKPSMGRIPVWPGCKDDRLPGVSSWDSLEHLGPLARDVEDVALVMAALAGPDPRDRFSLPGNPFSEPLPHGWLAGRSIAVSLGLGFVDVNDEVSNCVGQVIATLEGDFGCKVVVADPGFDDPHAAFGALIAADTDLEGMRRMAATHPFAPYVMDLLGRQFTAEDFTRARKMRQQVCRVMADYMADVDLLLTPTSPILPFSSAELSETEIPERRRRLAHWLALCNPFNLTGQPAISVPAGRTTAGAPVGVQLVGRHLADTEVLAAARDLQEFLRDTRWPTP